MSQPSVGISRRAYDTASRTVQNMAVQDWGVAAFQLYMSLRVLAAPDSPDAFFARRFALTLLTVCVATILAVRGELMPPGRARALLYRLGLFTPMVLSYFELKWLLPALQPKLVDLQLYGIDKMLFGTTPALWLARFDRVPIVEWFSFFYYSYFWILGLVLVPSLFFDRGRRLAQVMIGAMVVCGLGHSGYTVVPGLGPHATLVFAQPLHGGFFWGLVQEAVHSAGAQLDIFPSLHTAYPTYFALHAFGNRDRGPFKYTWPIFAFFAANIIVATMFLRWHWGIDVIFGLVLAFTARRVAVIVSRYEADRGLGADDRQPVWEPLWR